MNIENIIKNLERNNMNGIYVATKEEAKKRAEEMLFEGATICSGGSESLKESGIFELIKDKKYNYVDRMKAETDEEKQAAFKAVVGADFYFCSANALTENGELVNVDGFSNRISAIVFGPKKVIAVVGKNKIVKDVTEGFLRVKKIAAPKNNIRLGIDNPCAKLGKCVSLLKTECPEITDGCMGERRICRNYQISGHQAEKGRITVIICGEDLGY